MISHVVLVARIAMGAGLGGVIGYERDLHQRPVGLRTHLIVAMTAATFMVISSQFVYAQHYAASDLVTIDASRIAASVVSGIGFIAAGAILRTGFTVQGLTTAAGLWLVTAIGMCAGAGMFVESAAVTGFGIVALTVFRRFEDKHVVRRRVAVTFGDGDARVDDVVSAIQRLVARVSSVDYDHDGAPGVDRVELTLDVQITERVNLRGLAAAIESVESVRRVRIQQI